MVAGDKIPRILAKYDPKKLCVATIGSHSALNIFKGAHDEGFKTLAIVRKGEDKLYRHFKVADDFLFVKKYSDLLQPKVQDKLRKKNAVIIPHGSFNAYISQKKMEEELAVPMFGNRTLLRWETSRSLQRKWLKDAGLTVPAQIMDPKDITDLVLVKFPGAKGGRGYFICDSHKSFKKKMSEMVKAKLVTKQDAKNSHIQTYIIGVSVYPHYFQSPLTGETELIGLDKRYEASVDGIGRIPAAEQLEKRLNPSFTVVGNFPMVVRESLLPRLFDVGERVHAAAAKNAPPGCVGPFCLETIISENLKVTAFELSARIVAGCNVDIGGSPYTYLTYKEPMYMGRRISRELNNAIKKKRLGEVVT